MDGVFGGKPNVQPLVLSQTPHVGEREETPNSAIDDDESLQAYLRKGDDYDDDTPPLSPALSATLTGAEPLQPPCEAERVQPAPAVQPIGDVLADLDMVDPTAPRRRHRTRPTVDDSTDGEGQPVRKRQASGSSKGDKHKAQPTLALSCPQIYKGGVGPLMATRFDSITQLRTELEKLRNELGREKFQHTVMQDRERMDREERLDRERKEREQRQDELRARELDQEREKRKHEFLLRATEVTNGDLDKVDEMMRRYGYM